MDGYCEREREASPFLQHLPLSNLVFTESRLASLRTKLASYAWHCIGRHKCRIELLSLSVSNIFFDDLPTTLSGIEMKKTTLCPSSGDMVKLHLLS